MPTDTSEKRMETRVIELLCGVGYAEIDHKDYAPANALVPDVLIAFLQATQPAKVTRLGIGSAGRKQSNFLRRVRDELDSRGVIDVLMNGVAHGPEDLTLYFGTPTPGNDLAVTRHAQNRFGVMRQVHFSTKHPKLSLDLVLFLNGLPFITVELKNHLTGQTVADAIRQYKSSRDPKETLLRPGRCMAHFALDDNEAYFCTALKNKQSWFLPFNKGNNQGAGNPPVQNGLRTDYLWTEVLAPPSMIDILENYARKVSESVKGSRKKKVKHIFPRYHQLRSVRKLLADADKNGPGQRYLIQHSAGSGKSYSITWLTHQLVDLLNDAGRPLFDTVFVITDRRVLDKQIRDEIKRFTVVGAMVGAVTEGSQQLREFIQQGKRIITSTVQKFPYILEEIGGAPKHKTFAIVIDEAHSSQGGKTMTQMNIALSGAKITKDMDMEDQINALLEAKQMLSNASYFAFTATPKNKTEELFGSEKPDGTFAPFDVYTMKQAIQEGFIKDVLTNYTPVSSYYHVRSTVEGDPMVDASKAQKLLRRIVEDHDKSVQAKATVMVEHFEKQVYRKRLIGGQARAMVVTEGVIRAVKYFTAFNALIKEQNLAWRPIIAFSGSHAYGGRTVTEATLNGFPSGQIPEKLKEDPYRVLIVADKFQTGFDEPLLQAMYVDKPLSDVKAVQTLSRLNRAHPDKDEVFVLDFANTTEGITKSFQKYYQTTILSGATDRNKLHDLKRIIDGARIYTEEEVHEVVMQFLAEADRGEFYPLLDCAVHRYLELDEDEQVKVKSAAKAFARNYHFLSTILTFRRTDWERFSIYLDLLIPKLPTPKGTEEDDTEAALKTVDMDSYRNRKHETIKIILEEEDGPLEPAPTGGSAGAAEVGMEFLSEVIKSFNELFAEKGFEHPEKTTAFVIGELPAEMMASKAIQNTIRDGDRSRLRDAVATHATTRIASLAADNTRLFALFQGDNEFREMLVEKISQVMMRGESVMAGVEDDPDDADWDEAIELADAQWQPLLAGLAAAGVPLGGVERDLKRGGLTSDEKSVMGWTTDPPVWLIADGTDTSDIEGAIIVVNPDADPAAVAAQLHEVM